MPNDLPAWLGGMPVRPEGPPPWPIDDPAVRDTLLRVAADGSWGRYHGPHTAALTEALAQLHACRHVLLTSSGTAAVELALRGVGVERGDEVVMAAYDFKANFTNVCLLGAIPVLVDVDGDSGQLDVDRLPAAFSEKTRAVVVSHLHGSAAAMPELVALARRRGVAVIEDACQMSGATLYGRVAGMWGDVGVISFGGSKLLSAGRGGAVVSDRDDVIQRIRLYVQRGNEAYPLSEIQAALLIPQLERLSERRAERIRAVTAICRGLGESAVLRPFAVPEECVPDYYKLGFWYDALAMGNAPREVFCEAMRAEGIPLSPGFRGLHCIHARKRFRAADRLERASAADRSIVVLHHPYLLAGERGAKQFLDALDKLAQHATLLAGAGRSEVRE